MRTKIVAGTALAVLALGCCWAVMPRQPTASLLEAYRQTGLARECNHRPYHCQSRSYHEQRLALDELCYDSPRCRTVAECLKAHINYVYGLGCQHTIRCGNPIGHYNAIRQEQGLRPIQIH